MKEISLDDSLLTSLPGKTALITGSASGIGAETARLFNAHGANVIVADLEPTRDSAKTLIASFTHPDRAIFIPTNITDWPQMTSLFKSAKTKFGQIDIVVANAGVIESRSVLDFDNVDENGDLNESREGSRVIDINLKGTLNTLRLALFHMRHNQSNFSDGSKGSLVLISSMSGYFGGTGVAGYIASKHGITGLLRGSQVAAAQYNIRVNAVSPFFTPTAFTVGFAQAWADKGLEANTPAGVAQVVVHMALDTSMRGASCLTAGNILREMETTRTALLGEWLGEDTVRLAKGANEMFAQIGGYPLPKLAALE